MEISRQAALGGFHGHRIDGRHGTAGTGENGEAKDGDQQQGFHGEFGCERHLATSRPKLQQSLFGGEIPMEPAIPWEIRVLWSDGPDGS